MKYGIIGTGWIAEAFIEGARLKCNAEITSVYSRTAVKGKAFADKNSIKAVYNDLDDFLNGDIDSVYIASPNALHFSQSKKCLLAGKNVICEKPITVTADEYSECKSIADKKGLVYLEAIMYMHTPNRDRLREAMDKIGRVSSAHFDFSQLSSKYSDYLQGGKPNIFNPSLATGCLMDLGVYCVYPAVDLFGVPEKILADAVFLTTGSDGSGNASLNYGDKLITLTYSKTGQDYAGSFIYGDKGTISIESISKLINGVLTDSEGEKHTVCPYMEKAEIMGFEALEFEKFISEPNNEKYDLSSKITLQVSQLMEQIRFKAGIKFKEEYGNA